MESGLVGVDAGGSVADAVGVEEDVVVGVEGSVRVGSQVAVEVGVCEAMGKAVGV